MTFDANDIFKLILGVICGAFVFCMLLVFLFNKSPRGRQKGAIGVVVLFAGGLIWGYIALVIKPQRMMAEEAKKKGEHSEQERKERYEKAKAIFDKRCKSAGERIYKTVDNVEGIYLLKVRPKYQDKFGYDPIYPGAALIGKSGDEGYIASFLRYERENTSSAERSMQLSDKPTSRPGYSFVEVLDASDGKRYRYSKFYGPNNLPPAEYMPIPVLSKAPATDYPPRYAVTYEDLIDPEDRRNWVAGTVIKVIDTKTNEVMAEQTRYLFDTGLGSTAGNRNPWGWASSYVPGCSSEPRFQGETRFFVDQVLKPKQGN